MKHTLTKISQKDKACYDGGSADREIQITKARDIQVHQQLGQRLFPIVLTECLSIHQECTQEYSDTTNSFRIRCICSCHRKYSLLEENKKHAYLGSSQNKQKEMVYNDIIIEST